MAIGKDTVVNVRIGSQTIKYGNIGAVYYTDDVNTATITFNLMRGVGFLNLTSENVTPIISLKHSDTSEWEDEELEILDASKGKVRYTVPLEVARHKGTMSCSLYLQSETTNFRAIDFSFTIQDSGTESVIKKEIKIPLIEDIIIDLLRGSSIELLDESFKSNLVSDMRNYLLENSSAFKGETGTQGIKGEKGDTGEQGERGLQGIRGLPGIKGEKGDRGPQGIQGLHGTKGDQGDAGKDFKLEHNGALLQLIGNQTIPSETITIVSWGGAVYNTNGYWNPSSPSRLTVPPGVTKVRLGGSILWESSASGYRMLRILKNGNYVYGLPYHRYNAVSTAGYTGNSAVVECKAGDFFELEVYSNASPTVALREDPYTWFSIEAVELEKDYSSSFMLIGHRGAPGYIEEHTLEGYQMALDKGADYIELDLQLTSDNKLICMHDATLDRTTTGTGNVNSKTLAEIQGSYTTVGGKQIPSLTDVLDEFGTDVTYYIETKSPFNANMDAELLKQLAAKKLIGAGTPKFNVIIQSFALESLANIRNQYSNIPLAYLSSTFTTTDINNAKSVKAYAIAPKFNAVNSTNVAQAQAAGLKVHTWTVNTVDDMRTVIDAGVDGIFTNYLDRYKNVYS